MIDDLDPKHAKVYQSIRRMVLWDEPGHEIARVFAVNAVPEEISAAMLAHARAERIADLRGSALRSLFLGLGLMIAGLALFFGIAIATGRVMRGVFVTSGLLVVGGCYYLGKGIADFFLAPHKKGSIAHED